LAVKASAACCGVNLASQHWVCTVVFPGARKASGQDRVSQQRALDSGAGRGKTAGRFLPVAGARWTLWDGLRGGAFPKMVREAVLLIMARKRLLDMHGDRGISFLLWGEPGPIHCGGGRGTALGLEFSASWAIFRQAGQFLAGRTSFRASRTSFRASWTVLGKPGSFSKLEQCAGISWTCVFGFWERCSRAGSVPGFGGIGRCQGRCGLRLWLRRILPTVDLLIPRSAARVRQLQCVLPFGFACRVVSITALTRSGPQVGLRPRPGAISHNAKPSLWARALQDSETAMDYCMTTPPETFSLAFCSLILRAPMAFCTQS
jgi:hypothetical protein